MPTQDTRDSTHPKPVIGLMGAPGSGKSFVASLFAELGCGVIDADKLAHQAIQTDAVRDQLRQWWGEQVLDESGRVDRAAVGQIVFADEAALRQLEGVVHPLVHAGRAQERAQHFADAAVPAVVEDCPLLLESGLDQSCDALVYVDCPYLLRLERLAQSRGWDAAELEKREKLQTPLDTKRRSADYVISNGQTPAQVREQVEHVLKLISR